MAQFDRSQQRYTVVSPKLFGISCNADTGFHNEWILQDFPQSLGKIYNKDDGTT
jgi:hypothetical protein